jgi:hypothetical protein
MAGREKISVYVYNLVGEYIETFETISEFRKKWYPLDTNPRPLFNYNELGHEYFYSATNRIIVLRSRPGREVIKHILAIHNSEFCALQDTIESPSIEILNLRGDVIAVVKTQHLVSLLIPDLHPSTVSRQLNTDAKKSNIFKTGLRCQFKDDSKQFVQKEDIVPEEEEDSQDHISISEILEKKEKELSNLLNTIIVLRDLNKTITK